MNNLRVQLERMRGERGRIEKDILTLTQEEQDTEKAIRIFEDSRAILQRVAKETQDQLVYHLSELPSLALSTVFNDNYKLKVNFTMKRGRTDAEIVLEDNDGNQMNPMDASGGGVVDVATFALRIALWTLENPRSRSVFIMDEPFKNLSKDLHPLMGRMLKEISDKFQIQFIFVTHEATFIEDADKLFEVTIKNGRSVVK